MMLMKMIMKSSSKGVPMLPHPLAKPLLPHPFLTTLKRSEKFHRQMFCQSSKKKLNYTLDWHFKAEIEGRNGDKEEIYKKEICGRKGHHTLNIF